MGRFSCSAARAGPSRTATRRRRGRPSRRRSGAAPRTLRHLGAGRALAGQLEHAVPELAARGPPRLTNTSRHRPRRRRVAREDAASSPECAPSSYSPAGWSATYGRRRCTRRSGLVGRGAARTEALSANQPHALSGSGRRGRPRAPREAPSCSARRRSATRRARAATVGRAHRERSSARRTAEQHPPHERVSPWRETPFTRSAPARGRRRARRDADVAQRRLGLRGHALRLVGLRARASCVRAAARRARARAPAASARLRRLPRLGLGVRAAEVDRSVPWPRRGRAPARRRPAGRGSCFTRNERPQLVATMSSPSSSSA